MEFHGSPGGLLPSASLMATPHVSHRLMSSAVLACLSFGKERQETDR